MELNIIYQRHKRLISIINKINNNQYLINYDISELRNYLSENNIKKTKILIDINNLIPLYNEYPIMTKKKTLNYHHNLINQLYGDLYLAFKTHIIKSHNKYLVESLLVDKNLISDILSLGKRIKLSLNPEIIKLFRLKNHYKNILYINKETLIIFINGRLVLEKEIVKDINLLINKIGLLFYALNFKDTLYMIKSHHKFYDKLWTLLNEELKGTIKIVEHKEF